MLEMDEGGIGSHGALALRVDADDAWSFRRGRLLLGREHWSGAEKKEGEARKGRDQVHGKKVQWTSSIADTVGARIFFCLF